MRKRSGRLEPQGTGTGPRALCPARLPAGRRVRWQDGDSKRIGEGKLPQNAVVYNAGVSRQDRNWFWYRRTFRAAGNRAGTLPLRTGSSRFRSVCLDIKSGSYPRSLEAFRTVMNRWGSKEISGRKKTMPPTAAAKQ